jgi:hypothetical protein
MRNYATVSSQFWVNQQGLAIRKLGTEAQTIALYLMTCPNSNILGVYYLPIVLVAHETSISFEKVSTILQDFCEIGFCCYDYEREYVWVIDMADEQIKGQIQSGDNPMKSIHEAYLALPDLPFLPQFFERYEKLFPLGRVFEGVDRLAIEENA